MTATNPSPHRNMERDSGTSWSRNRYQAPVAATHMPVVRKAASSMCGHRTRMMGPVVIAHQSPGSILPLTTTWPSGTCIQLLLARIQKDENMVPSETMQQERK